MNNNYFIAIMAGGVGTRFWPSSRTSYPKQFLDVLQIGKPLLKMTYDRACKIVPQENVLIVSNQRYADLIKEQIPEIQEKNILLEPSMNNTAPCIAYAALHLKARNVGKVSFAVMPSDHIILDEATFAKKMLLALDTAHDSDDIITLGITPTRPDTGYGYIKFEGDNEIKNVMQFKEKPDYQTATSYMSSGQYVWNAGIFCWSTETVINGFVEHATDVIDVLLEKSELFGSPQEQEYIQKVYPNTRSVSIDYAILEQSQNIKMIMADVGWTDLGTWASLHKFLEKDENENVIQGSRIHTIDSRNNLIKTKNAHKLVVIKGLEDYIIVDEDDILLVYPKGEEQSIKEVRRSLPYPDLK